MPDIMDDRKDMETDIKRLREEVSELRKMINLILGLMMEEEGEEFAEETDREDSISSLYN